ncbi:MAG: DUF2252 family protein [Aeromicrobium sp.]
MRTGFPPPPQLQPKSRKRTEAMLAKARTRDSMQAFSKLTTTVDGQTRIISNPPLIVPVGEFLSVSDVDGLYRDIRKLLRSYPRTLPLDRGHLLSQYRLVQMAHKVVGVGSVGNRAWILLMEGIDGADPLFLQAKGAQSSVLEEFAGASKFKDHGRRGSRGSG